MFFAGEWRNTPVTANVVSPYSGQVIDTVPQADVADVDRALATLQSGAVAMRQLPAFRRAEILHKAAAVMRARVEDLARTISSEEGKALAESRTEARRAADVITTSAEEALRIAGEMIPLEGAEHGAGKLGFTLRVPCGIVAAITPFNFPLNLVAHKVGPALAAGNAVIIKPASDTPLSALKLTVILLESGLPPEAIACVTGPGGALGRAICTDDRVRKISFTGSYETGDAICKLAGIKRVTMELGSNSPVIVMDDADLDRAAAAIATAGYSNAGRVCISAQADHHQPQHRRRFPRRPPPGAWTASSPATR
ncbi:MAG: aldehyde dehydrogenase family protein [Planctomycetaceae bacterium]